MLYKFIIIYYKFIVIITIQTNCRNGWYCAWWQHSCFVKQFQYLSFLYSHLQSLRLSPDSRVFVWVMSGFPPLSKWTSGLWTNFGIFNFTLKKKKNHHFQIPVKQAHANPYFFYQFLRAWKARRKFSVNVLKLDCYIWRWCCALGIWRDAFYVFWSNWSGEAAPNSIIISSFQAGFIIEFFEKERPWSFALPFVFFWSERCVDY